MEKWTNNKSGFLFTHLHDKHIIQATKGGLYKPWACLIFLRKENKMK